MSKSAISVLVFSGYLALTGLTFLVLPNLGLPLFGFAETSEPWIRVVGTLTLVLAYFFAQSARSELRRFFQLTIHARIFVFLTLGIMGLSMGLPMLAAFGVIDLLAASWTFLALRAERRGA